MNQRRFFLTAIGAMVYAPASRAQIAGKVYRIGYLGLGLDPELTRASTDPLDVLRRAPMDAFRHAMRSAGWIEGSNYVIDKRYEEGRPERYPELAKELVSLGPDVLMSVQTQGIRALMQATPTIPIVMLAPGDPAGSGLVASLARPGGNVTGLAFDVDLGTYIKQVEVMREVMPNLTSVAVFANPAARLPPVAPLAAAISSQLGLKSVLSEARSVDEIEAAFADLRQQGVRAAIVIIDGFLGRNVKRVADMGIKYRVALGSQWQGVPLAGGLMSYAPDLIDNFARAAGYVDRIFRGAKPADLPVDSPARIKLILNRATAGALGLVIPRPVLLRADEVLG
jgi:putative ABC transport system substrate-binding protein